MCIVSNIKILVCVSILIASVLSFGKVLIDEDFTDGKLDNTNAGDNGSRWSYFGGGDVGFKTPNNRSGFSKALARRSDGGGSSWAGLKWQVWNDDNGNNEKEPEEFKRFSIEKGTQAIYAEFTCFSDVAKSSADYYGVEIAMLEEVSDASYQGNPHYGHDLSFEVKQAFSTSGSHYQLETNVENDAHRNETCVKYAHYEGGTTKSALGKVYTNLSIWEPAENSTAIRQWSTRFQDCKYTAAEMKHGLNPDASKAEFNFIQVTLFRGGISSSDLIRDGASKSNAQIGILRVKVGIIDKDKLQIKDGHVVDDEIYPASGQTGVLRLVRNKKLPGNALNTIGKGSDLKQLKVFYDISGKRLGVFADRCSTCAGGATVNRNSGLYIIHQTK